MGLNSFLIFIPIALALDWWEANPIFVFVTAALAIVALAGLMGKATENLSLYIGATLGGLLTATLGNAPELIISVFALQKGLHTVVKASITGTILGNLLLTLGLSMFAGGLRHERQYFNRTSAGMSAGLLLLAAVGLIIPALFHYTSNHQERELSLEIAIVLFIVYLLSLLFTLKTHRQLFGEEASNSPQEKKKMKDGELWSKNKSIGVLVTVTVFLAVMSETFTGAIEPAAKSLGLTAIFTGVVLLAIVGNSSDLINSVRFARNNQMDLSFGIAVGSSIQVALLVAPVLVFFSYIIGKPFDLLFTPFEVVALTITVLTIGRLTNEGECHWLQGVMLIGVYLILGIGFFFLPV